MTATVAEYVLLWALYCLLAGAILARDRKTLLPEWRDYFRFLTVPWKICVFVPAFLFVSFAGHFTNDETWDFVTGSGMSILTFLTAPWAIGLFCQVFAGKRPRRYLIVASALCFFSSSWFYDSYLLWRRSLYAALARQSHGLDRHLRSCGTPLESRGGGGWPLYALV